MGHLLRLYETYKGRATFLLVFIQDAGHPDPQTTALLGEPGLEENATPEECLRYIRKGLDGYKISFPALLDEGGEAERAYDAYPKRLVVVGADGRVVHDGGRGVKGGPSDWDLEEVERHLRAAVSGDRPGG